MSHDARKLALQGGVFLIFALVAMGFVLRSDPEPREIEVTEIGVKVLQETPGVGRPVEEGNTVCIAYTIRLPDGTVVLEDRDFCFVVGGNSVIAGVDEAVRGMRPRGRRTVDCPPHKHWGRAGYADKIPPVTNLEIEIFLKTIRS